MIRDRRLPRPWAIRGPARPVCWRAFGLSAKSTAHWSSICEYRRTVERNPPPRPTMPTPTASLFPDRPQQRSAPLKRPRRESTLPHTYLLLPSLLGNRPHPKYLQAGARRQRRGLPFAQRRDSPGEFCSVFTPRGTHCDRCISILGPNAG
jgi:hypothetical protein